MAINFIIGHQCLDPGYEWRKQQEKNKQFKTEMDAVEQSEYEREILEYIDLKDAVMGLELAQIREIKKGRIIGHFY